MAKDKKEKKAKSKRAESAGSDRASSMRTKSSGMESRITGVSIPNEKSHYVVADHQAATLRTNKRANEPLLASDTALKQTVSASKGGAHLGGASHFATTPDDVYGLRGMNGRNGAMLRTPEERHEVGCAAFQDQAEFLRSVGLASDESPQAESHRCKVDTELQLDCVADAAQQGLKMCGSDGAIYLLERIIEEVTVLHDIIQDDTDYQEEVRFKHCKLHTLLDESRDFPAASLQRDLIRNREIRAKCAELIRGGRPEPYTIDEEEVQELVRVRNSIRTWYGGQNTLKGLTFDANSNDRTIMQMRPSEVAVKAAGHERFDSDFVATGDDPGMTGINQD